MSETRELGDHPRLCSSRVSGLGSAFSRAWGMKPWWGGSTTAKADQLSLRLIFKAPSDSRGGISVFFPIG